MISAGSIWHKVKKTFSGSTKDDKEEEHRDGFTALVRELKAALRGDGLVLTAAILPHVNSTGTAAWAELNYFRKTSSASCLLLELGDGEGPRGG